MAHIFHVPISFDFKVRKLSWVEVQGRITDSSTDMFGDPQLKAELSVNGNTMFLNVDSEATPDKTWERWVNFVESDNHDAAARQLISDFRPLFFIALGQRGSQNITDANDAWRLRDALLKLEPTSSNVLAFLNRWGRWTYDDYTQLHEILDFRKKIRRALLSPPDEWLSGYESNVDPLTRSQYPNLSIHTDICVEAIRATVTLDLLRKTKFKTCLRSDCRQPFQVTSRHWRKYCCQYCAHLESLRRIRAHSRRSQNRYRTGTEGRFA